MGKRLSDYIHAWFNSKDATKDVKLLSYLMVVIFSIYKLVRSDIDANWVNAYYGLCALVGLGGTAWAAVERWKGGKDGPADKGSSS